MRCQRRTCGRPHPGHNLHQSWWEETTILNDLCEETAGKRCLLRGLEDNSIPSCQCGGDVCDGKDERAVPRDDHRAHAIGLLQHEVQMVGCTQAGVAVYIHPESGVVCNG